MSNPGSRRINTTGTDNERNSLNGKAMADVNNKKSSPEASVTSEEVARRKRTVPDLFTKQLDFMKDLRQSNLRRN